MNHLEMGNLSIAILSNQRVFVAKAAQGVLDPDGPP